jgi:hypothetical protein
LLNQREGCFFLKKKSPSDQKHHKFEISKLRRESPQGRRLSGLKADTVTRIAKGGVPNAVQKANQMSVFTHLPIFITHGFEKLNKPEKEEHGGQLESASRNETWASCLWRMKPSLLGTKWTHQQPTFCQPA